MAENYSRGGMLVKALEIKENVFYVGVQDYDLRVFDIVMRTEYGTSYNAYLVKGREKTVLIETVKDKFLTSTSRIFKK